jgi:ATP-dependent Clp protease ATP-binding subunit ClpC
LHSSSEDREAQEAREQIEEGLQRTFRPEFLNRIDETIIFHTLTLEHMIQIVDLQMQEIRERLEERGITVELSQAACDWLAEEGYDSAFGARPLRRTLQRHVESPLSKRILKGEFESGDHILVDTGESEAGEPVLLFQKQEPIPVELPVKVEEVKEAEAEA